MTNEAYLSDILVLAFLRHSPLVLRHFFVIPNCAKRKA